MVKMNNFSPNSSSKIPTTPFFLKRDDQRSSREGKLGKANIVNEKDHGFKVVLDPYESKVSIDLI